MSRVLVLEPPEGSDLVLDVAVEMKCNETTLRCGTLLGDPIGPGRGALALQTAAYYVSTTTSII
jgi:hypothetical protein